MPPPTDPSPGCLAALANHPLPQGERVDDRPASSPHATRSPARITAQSTKRTREAEFGLPWSWARMHPPQTTCRSDHRHRGAPGPGDHNGATASRGVVAPPATTVSRRRRSETSPTAVGPTAVAAGSAGVDGPAAGAAAAAVLAEEPATTAAPVANRPCSRPHCRSSRPRRRRPPGPLSRGTRRRPEPAGRRASAGRPPVGASAGQRPVGPASAERQPGWLTTTVPLQPAPPP